MAMKVFKPKGDGISGNIKYIHAKVKTGETKALITDLAEDGESFKVMLEDLPEGMNIPNGVLIDEASVIWDADNEKVLAINPYVGVFEAVGVELGPKPNGDVPMAEVKEKVGNDKKPYTIKQFYEVFKITDKNEQDGVFYGSRPRLFLQDKYGDDGDGMAGISGTDKSKWTMRLKQFGESQGLYDEEVAWPKDGNILPELEKRLQENKTKVRLVFENGFISSISPLKKRQIDEVIEELGYEKEKVEAPKKSAPKEELDVDADFPEEPKKAKKSAKKVAADEEDDL